MCRGWWGVAAPAASQVLLECPACCSSQLPARCTLEKTWPQESGSGQTYALATKRENVRQVVGKLDVWTQGAAWHAWHAWHAKLGLCVTVAKASILVPVWVPVFQGVQGLSVWIIHKPDHSEGVQS